MPGTKSYLKLQLMLFLVRVEELGTLLWQFPCQTGYEKKLIVNILLKLPT